MVLDPCCDTSVDTSFHHAPKHKMAEEQSEQAEEPENVTCLICTTIVNLKDPQNHARLTRACPRGCIWCDGCLEQRFVAATNQPSQMPPRCCGGFIHLNAVRLPEEIESRYQQRFREYATPGCEKLYCPIPSCSTFIPVRKGKDPRCPHCSTRVCQKCHRAAHANSECPTNHADERTKRLLNKLGYKHCPGCGMGIRRMFGCASVSSKRSPRYLGFSRLNTLKFLSDGMRILLMQFLLVVHANYECMPNESGLRLQRR